jgi:hypothetical protein
LSARSDEAELDVAPGAAVGIDADVAIEVAAVAAVAVGLAMALSVGACGNKLPYNPSEHMQRRKSFFIECLIIGCSERPIWIQRFCASQGN